MLKKNSGKYCRRGISIISVYLLALPVASRGLKLDDEAVVVAVALRLSLNLTAPHTCCCGATFDALGQHSLTSSKQDSQTSAPERLGDPCLGISGRPCHKRTSRSYAEKANARTE